MYLTHSIKITTLKSKKMSRRYNKSKMRENLCHKVREGKL